MRVHFFLQGKGGTGKSLTACLLAQHLLDSGRKVVCIDTDPINHSLSRFQRLDVHAVDVIENGEINSGRFDEVMDLIEHADADDVIIDNGASSFVSFCNYLIQENWVEFVASGDAGWSMHLHCVMVGGQAYEDTLAGIRAVCRSFLEPAMVHLWLNPYFGPVVNSAGVPFEETKTYQQIVGRIASIVRLPLMNRQTQGSKIGELMKKGLTFEEIDADAGISVYFRHQIRIIRKLLYEQIQVLDAFE